MKDEREKKELGQQVDQQLEVEKPETIDYMGYIHSQQMYDLGDKVQNMFEQFNVAQDVNFKQLMSIFTLKNADKDRKIPFNKIYSLCLRSNIQD